MVVGPDLLLQQFAVREGLEIFQACARRSGPHLPAPGCEAAALPPGFLHSLLGIAVRTLENNTGEPELTAPRAHGLADAPSSNALSEDRLQAAVRFVLRVAEAEGVPNPRFGFSRSAEDGPDIIDNIIDNIIHLPPRFTLGVLYHDYCKFMSTKGREEELVVSDRTFQILFKERPELRHVKTSVRSRGVCELCKDLRLSLQACGTDARMAEVQNAYREHLNRADVQRCLVPGATAGECGQVERRPRSPGARNDLLRLRFKVQGADHRSANASRVYGRGVRA